ncbi:tetratricopeptide repeat protein [Alphaproteobacteria bacterium KMM 3653]|uniref:Tetratricopeptide repeat protein n=1 Tax=Harenicola maris TaxID=2841044 RepID=A0AAP2CRL6_9RHOB|nr:tetratricopeptide repeat protein [Harenicola maris]
MAQKPETIQRQHDLFHGLNKRGKALLEANRFEEALRTSYDARDLAEGHLRQDPENEHWRGFLCVSHDRIGTILFKQGLYEEALQVFRDCLALQERLEDRTPKTTVGQENIARSHGKIGATLIKLGRKDEGLKAQREAQAIREGLPEIHRESREWRDGYF